MNSNEENNFETISLNKLKSKDTLGDHLLFYLLIINTIIALLLISFLFLYLFLILNQKFNYIFFIYAFSLRKSFSFKERIILLL